MSDLIVALNDAIQAQLDPSTTVMGPSPSPTVRKRAEFYWFVLYVTDNVLKTGHVIRHVVRHARIPKDVRVSIDVDPMVVG